MNVQTRAIRAAAATRSDDAAARARRVLREMAKRGAAVNFAAIAAAAGVSRQFLYTHPELRQEIELLRDEQHSELSRLPVAERASDASIRARLRGALDDNQRLREENARLREELALAHGRVRELELDGRARRT
jgi:predicted Zn-dependent protease